MATIVLAREESTALPWALVADLEEPTADHPLRANAVFVRAGPEASVEVVAEADLDIPIEIPRILTVDEGSGNFRLKNRNEIEADLTDAVIAARAELTRRFSRLEITWRTSGKAFFGMMKPFDASVSAFMSGYARLHLGRLLGPEPANDALPVVELVLLGAVDADIDFGGSRQYHAAAGVVVILWKGRIPALRIDLDDFNFGFPEFPIGSLKLPDLGPIDWPGQSIGAVARAFERLLVQIGVTVEVTPTGGTTPQLLLENLTTAPTWKIVQKEAPANLQTFDVKVAIQAGTLFTVTNVTAGYSGGRLKISGTATVTTTVSIDPGSRELGPLRLLWSGVTLKPRFDMPINGGSGPILSAEVAFDRLVLLPRDEPDVELVLRGTILLTPNGVRIISLQIIVGTDVIALAMAAQRLLNGVLQVLASFDPNTPNLAPILAKLLHILSRLAAAAARAAGFVAQLIGDLLVGIARAIGKLLEILAELMKQAGENVTIEIRLTVDPIEILQVVITARHHAARTGPAAISAAGLSLEIPQNWQPALLIDLVAQPGVYLMAVPSAHDDTVAVFATDLWLRQATDVATIRDADPGSGNRAAKPVLTLKLKNKSAELLSIVLAGVRRREPVFLQKIVTPASTVMLSDGTSVTVCAEKLLLEPLTDADLGIEIDFDKKRVLGLLGLGDSGETTTGTTGFLDSLQQVVWVEEFTPAADLQKRTATMDVTLGVKVGGLTAKPKLKLALSLDDLSVDITGSHTIDLTGKKMTGRALGLEWEIRAKDEDEGPLFQLRFNGPSTSLELDSRKTLMELRYTDLSSDGRGLVFTVEKFVAGRGGIDLDARISDQSIRLNGLDVPFRFSGGRLTLRGGRLVEATVEGKGKLPPQLVGDAGASIALIFTQRDGAIELQSGTARLDKVGEPIVCHATRFTLTIANLGLDFVREDGQVHFYFVVTGTLQFTPNAGEFENGLLQFLKEARLNLEKVPLAGDGRVLARHISFQVAIKPKLHISLFDLFSFELRGIGFHPASPKFDGQPAMNVSGQIAFAEIGDVVSPKIDFHGLWIAPPAKDQALPRIKADGLGVDIGLPGTARLSGTVLAVDERLPTLEGSEFAPPEYKTYGFLGEGRLAIEGFATLAASFGFLEIVLPDRPDERRKAFFLFVQQEQVAYEIPTPVWTLYMREVGFGFGFRYTLEGIKEAEKAASVAELIRRLDEVSTRQGELASFAAWRPDAEKDNVTLALRGAIQFAPAAKTWDERREQETPNPFLFDLVAALRSDMTFLMSVRGWPSVNYYDFFKNTNDLRTKPFFRGYLYISAPRSELLARFISDPNGVIGKNPMLYPQLELALRAVQFSSTLYIRPGLFHFELGWPDQLRVTLYDKPNLRAEVRGGMIFRVWDQCLLTGFNIEANAYLRIGGEAGGDSLGVSAEASLTAAFTARFIAFLDLQNGKFLFYGLATLDACLVLRVSAWLRVDLRFTKFTIRIGFSFSIQLSVALELAIAEQSIGALADVRVAISVFGATLAVRVGFTIAGGELEAARARVQRFMAMSLTADAPEPSRLDGATKNEKALGATAKESQDTAAAPVHEKPVPETPKTGDVIGYAALGIDIPLTNFRLVLRQMERRPASLPPDGELVLAMLVPMDGHFFAGGAPAVRHLLRWTEQPQGAFRLKPDGRTFEKISGTEVTVDATVDSKLPDSDTVTLRSLLDACFLIDAKFQVDHIEVTRYREPREQTFAPASRLPGADERARAAKRHQHQRAFNSAAAAHGEIVTAVRDARTTLLGHFIEQFTALAESGVAADGLNVADYGLVFALPTGKAEAFASTLSVKKSDVQDLGNTDGFGSVALLNAEDQWFSSRDPVLRDSRFAITPAGIKLDWDLSLIFDADEPEQHLHHYEIERVVEGRDFVRQRFKVKPVSTPGGTEKEKDPVPLFKPDWQFTDDLADLPDQVRQALLPMGGPEAAPTAAANWIRAFQEDTEVTITYVVTPVDIAGSRGLTRSILVDVEKPATAVRPATAQLIAIVPRGPLQTPRDPNDPAPPQGLRVYLGISDPHWDSASLEWKSDDQPIEDGKLSRGYRLILDPDDIVPSGLYGADGLTARVRTPGVSDDLLPNADEMPSVFMRRDLTKGTNVFEAGAVPEPLVLSADERKQFPFWIDVSSLVPDLAQRMWSRREPPHTRVAVRAYLETLLEVRSLLAPQAEPVKLASRRVPVDLELRVAGATDVAMRPPAFEWPVRLDFPPLTQRRVRARSGLAYFRGPDGGALDQDVQTPVEYLDPERRTLTEVEWSAVPEGGSAQLVAGHDLFELDLDELAPSKTVGALQNDEKAWERARRLARVQLLRRSVAMLTPGIIDDPTAWHAQMPSEVWRCNRANGSGGSLPIRKAWYSPRESCLDWPSQMPRQILLDGVDDGVIVSLLEHGKPKMLRVRLEVGGREQPVDLAHRKIVHELGLFDLAGGLTIDNGIVKKSTGNDPLTISEIRRALLCLMTTGGADVGGGVLTITALTPATVNRVSVDDAGVSTLHSDTETLEASRTLTLAPDRELHPLLADALDLLGWCLSDPDPPKAALYRRYEILPEPAPPIRVKSLATLLTATDPEKDPYGWMALANLGLAASIKMHDGDTGEFVKPGDIISRARRVFADAVSRYPHAGGAPLLDLFLRPGRDLVAGEIDGLVRPQPAGLDADDEALAFVQLSLRPRPLQSYRYARVTIPRPPAPATKLQVTLSDAKAFVSIYRRAERSTVVLSKDAPVQTLTLLPESIEPRVLLVVRYPAFDTPDDIKVRFDAEGAEVSLFADPVQPDQSGDSPYESGAFPELDPERFAELMGRGKDPDRPPSPERRSLAAFVRYAARIPKMEVPARWANEVESLTAAELLEFVTPYVAWSKRFLEHTLLPAQTSGFSFCGPVRQQPWKLAAESDGSVRLSFLHQDRFAHARAYAVRPVGRYHELAVAMQTRTAGDSRDPRASMEALIPPQQHPEIGHAVAVSPRTARLEAPAILSSRVLDDDSAGAWQIVVARHHEQDLVLSNRSLFARLAFEGTALTFVQDYPQRAWPKGLATIFSNGELLPDYTLVPPRRRPEAADIGAIPNLADADLIRAAADDPSLWKGGDIYRVSRLPHHLRTTVLASARAGAVVSPIAHAAQHDFAYLLPDSLLSRATVGGGDEAIPEPRWGLVTRDGKKLVCFRINALSYADAMPREIFAEWAAKGADVAFWPDPGIQYVLARRSKGSNADVIVEDEAKIVGVVPEPPKQQKLFVLRALGPSWQETDAGVEIEHKGDTDRPLFFLSAFIAPRELRAAPLSFTEPADPAAWQPFIDAAGAVVELSAAGGGGVMRLLALPDDALLDTLEALGDAPSKQLVALFKKVVVSTVLDGSPSSTGWVLRAEKGNKGTPQSRAITSRWSE